MGRRELEHLLRRAEERRVRPVSVRVWARSPSPASDAREVQPAGGGPREETTRPVSPEVRGSEDSDRAGRRREKLARRAERERARREAMEERVREVREVREADDSEEEMGPAPLSQLRAEERRVRYGGDLLPGEGAALASYVQQNLRIPRRGEIGWSGDAIDQLEGKGYVMSGSRHRRMNAVRIRKENQVYSAEERRALAAISLEERQARESRVVGDLRALLHQRLQKPA